MFEVYKKTHAFYIFMTILLNPNILGFYFNDERLYTRQTTKNMNIRYLGSDPGSLNFQHCDPG